MNVKSGLLLYSHVKKFDDISLGSNESDGSWFVWSTHDSSEYLMKTFLYK